MKKYEKEILQSQLDMEAAELKKLKAIYMQAADDCAKKIKFQTGKIDVLLNDWDDLGEKEKSILQSQIYQRKYQQALQKQISEIIDNMNNKQYATVSEYLTDCYENGFVSAMYSLHKQGVPIIMPLDQKAVVKGAKLDSKVSKKLYGSYVTELKKHIRSEVSRGVATSLPYKDIARNLNMQTNIGLNKAMRIARTEGHNVQVSSSYETSQRAKEKGADVLKQWSAALDGRTRDSHRRVDGEIRELDEKFSNGLKYPGDSAGGAAEVVNCRCALLQRAKWALDEDELETLKERAKYYGLDKTKNFDDFRQKYLKAVEKSAKSSKIPSKADDEVLQMAKGEKVNHKSFGAGTIIDSDEKTITIDFGEKGTKRLSKEFAVNSLTKAAAEVGADLKKIEAAKEKGLAYKKLKAAQDKILSHFKGMEKAEWQGSINIKVKNNLYAEGHYIVEKDYKLKGKAAMRKFLKDYTDGSTYLFGTANSIADSILKNDRNKLKEYLEDWLTGEHNSKIAKNLKILENAMEQNKTAKTLYRYETTSQVSGDIHVGRTFDWGLRSTSADSKWIETVASRGYLTDADLEKENIKTGTPIIYEITGTKKAIDIKDFSEFPEQEEWLISGTFEAVEVNNDGKTIRVKLKPVKRKAS